MPFTKKRKTVLDKNDIMKMIKEAYETYADDTPKARETASLIAALWKTGARISEILSIKREDIKIAQDTLNITIKPLKQYSKNVFPSILPFRLFKDKKKNFLNKLIITQTEDTMPKHRVWSLGRTTAWERITAIRPDIYPHLFRHSRATILADRGANEAQLRRWFRWSRFSKMPLNYVNLSKIQMMPISKLTED